MTATTVTQLPSWRAEEGSLFGAVRDIEPVLVAGIDEGEQSRQLPRSVWDALLDRGILRALQPARWGGGEVAFIEFFDAVRELARINSSAGWIAGVIGVHPWQLALFDERAQDEMWSVDPSKMHSSSYNPTGKAEAVEGGYRLSGRWSFSSGCDHCSAVNLGAVVHADGRGDYRSFLLHGDQYRIEDNWHVAGLKATGSKDIVVEDAFVPAHRSQSHLDYAAGATLPGQAMNSGALYRQPWSVVFNSVLVAAVLGMARGYIDAWVEECKARVASGGRLADDPLSQRRLAEATWDLEAAIAIVRADLVALAEMAERGETPTMALRGAMRWRMNRGCERVAEAIGQLFRAASGRSIFLSHPLQRRYQDLQAGMAHAFLVADPLARAVGGQLLETSKPEMVL
jgi:3-hydroxy-9,10-secoandrosta-1,3,5(10)-triene-9,17-dione monooxygenase